MANPEKDEVTGTETTGHEWDGIRELNTPLPRWWVWTFIGTIVWGLGYVIAYPAFPLLHTNTKGLLNTTNRAALNADLRALRKARGEVLAKMEKLSVEDIAKDPKLREFAVNMGHAAFKSYCVQCHGSGAEGSFGYPNLNDDDWLWGGTLSDIYYTIKNGVRYEPDVNEDTRTSDMPAFADQLEPAQIDAVAEYVLKLSGQKHDEAKAAEGDKIFHGDAGCNGCHGEKGEGSKDVGAPRLSDRIWLYKGDKASIISQIKRPKHGVMPAWGYKNRLDDATIKALAIYVHSLGGGAKS
jgi:cytochrome c oxidase cbb3-type subunit 3